MIMDALLGLQSEILRSRSALPYDEDFLDDWLQRLLSVLAELGDWETYDDDDASPSPKEESTTPDPRHLLVMIVGQTLERSLPHHESASRTNQTERMGTPGVRNSAATTW
jgi:hypothetical protein